MFSLCIIYMALNWDLKELNHVGINYVCLFFLKHFQSIDGTIFLAFIKSDFYDLVLNQNITKQKVNV